MADIIRLFASNETTFDHNETVLTDMISFVSSEEENGIFSFEATSPLDDRIVEGKIIKAPTARGEQLFRIIRVKKVIPGNYLYIYGRHITYDLLNNFILNIRPTDTTQANALSAILGGTETAHTFTSTSDVPGINTANYVRMNPIQAIMGSQANSALNLWGGYLRRDNFEFKVLATSPDKGYEIRFGKNLIGIEEELDMTEVVTRFYPTVVIEEPTVTALPEKYVDSPLINNYPTPIIKEYRIDLTDDEKLLPIADIYQLMRDRCNEQFTLKADLPKMNYKIDFVQLRKTEQYKHLAILEELDISDTVWAYVDPLNLSMSARMIKYTHDGLNDRFMSMELGNFKAKLTNQKAEFTKLVETATKELTDGTITTMLKDAVDRIQGNLGGNVVTITNDGKPVAMAFMDTDDVNTANEYIIINNKGIAFGVNGLNNPPELAIDIDGSIVGDSAFFRSLTTNLIQSELGNDLVLSSNTSIRFVSNNSATLDEDGFTIEDTASPNKTTLKPDGMEVKNKSTDMDLLVVTPDGTYIPTLTADSIQSDSIVRAVGNLSHKTITYYLAPAATGDGSGRDEYNKADNFQTALTNATNGGLVLKNVDIIIDIAPGKYNGLWRIMGYMGLGSIQILFNPGTYLNGHIDIYDCACKVLLTAGATGDFTLTKGDLVNGITLLNASNVFIERPVIIHPVATGYPVYLENSNLVISSYDIAGDPNTSPVRAIFADLNSRVYAMFGKGNTQNGAFSSLRGSILTAGYGIPMPAATASPDCNAITGTYFPRETARTISSAVVPAISWQSVSKTFTADLYRINQSTMWRTNGEMAQGKSPNSGEPYKGYATWGNAISEYLNSNGGYQNITSIVLGVTRGGWGYGDDALKITSPSTKTMSVQSRYTTATTELLGSALQPDIEASANLILSTSTLLTDDYANFTKVTMKIVCEKRV